MPDAPLERAFAAQVGWCRDTSPFTARLLERSWRFLQREPAALQALAQADDDPLAGAVTLRWAGALHLLALRGLQPWASAWPPAVADDDSLDAAIASAWSTQRPLIERALAHAPQTNEVQRSAILLPGLLVLAAEAGRPLALLEIGASAGLNLWPERHRYDYGTWAWGDRAAPLALRCPWRGAAPPLPPLRVVQRAACDAAPIDITQPAEALRLKSYVWADQHERLARLDAAVRASVPWMQADGVAVQRERAGAFVERALAARPAGAATVLMHAIVWQYIAADEQQAIERALHAAARDGAPLAWLRFEPPAPDRMPEIRCTVWPGAHDVCIGRAHAHVDAIDA